MARYVTIDSERCKGCWLCIDHCPNELLQKTNVKNKQGYLTINIHNQEFCLGSDCLNCVAVCPDNVFSVPEEKPDKISGKFYWLGQRFTKAKKYFADKNKKNEK